MSITEIPTPGVNQVATPDPHWGRGGQYVVDPADGVRRRLGPAPATPGVYSVIQGAVPNAAAPDALAPAAIEHAVVDARVSASGGEGQNAAANQSKKVKHG